MKVLNKANSGMILNFSSDIWRIKIDSKRTSNLQTS